MNLLKYHSDDAYFPLVVVIIRTSSPSFNVNGVGERVSISQVTLRCMSETCVGAA